MSKRASACPVSPKRKRDGGSTCACWARVEPRKAALESAALQRPPYSSDDKSSAFFENGFKNGFIHFGALMQMILNCFSSSFFISNIYAAIGIRVQSKNSPIGELFILQQDANDSTLALVDDSTKRLAHFTLRINWHHHNF